MGYGRNAVASYDMYHQQNSSGGGRNPIGRRTQSNQAANAIQSGGERNPIGRRTQSDRAANAIRLGGVRCTMAIIKLSPFRPTLYTVNL